MKSISSPLVKLITRAYNKPIFTKKGKIWEYVRKEEHANIYRNIQM